MQEQLIGQRNRVEFSDNLQIFEPCKQSEDNFIAFKTFASCCKIESLYKVWENICSFA